MEGMDIEISTISVSFDAYNDIFDIVVMYFCCVIRQWSIKRIIKRIGIVTASCLKFNK